MVLVDGVIAEGLKARIQKYCPDAGLLSMSSRELAAFASSNISIEKGIRSGRACIKGSRIAVCDVVADTLDFSLPFGFENKQYGGSINNAGVAAAFAFFATNYGKAAKDLMNCYELAVPSDFYLG